MRHLQCRLHLRLQPHRHGPHAAQGQPAIIRAGILAEFASRRMQGLPVVFAVHRNGADQHIGVPSGIFGRSLDRNIDAMLEWGSRNKALFERKYGK